MTKNYALDFPLLATQVGDKPLVYLDSAATSQKPKVVLDAMAEYYRTSNANVHRGVHSLSETSTSVWEQSRKIIAQFFGADVDELILVRNTTEAINGVAYGWADHNLKADDVILTSIAEHHSNFVVWQQVAKRTGASVVTVGMTADGRLDLLDLEKKLQLGGVMLVALAHVSNVLGTLLPTVKVLELVRKHAPSARVLLDGAQAAPHIPIDFHKLGVDFFAFSGHKMYGPMGVGGLLVRKELLATNEMRPWAFGGGMIDKVHLESTTFSESISDRFTAGTPDVASALGLAAACEYLSAVGMQTVADHDKKLVLYALEKLSSVPKVSIIGPMIFDNTFDRVGSVAFIYEGVHAHDVSQIIDSEGVAVRSGHHCAMPLHEQFGWAATVRASFGIYNTKSEIDALVASLSKVERIFNHV